MLSTYPVVNLITKTYKVQVRDHLNKVIWSESYLIPDLPTLRGLAKGLSKKHFISVRGTIFCLHEDLYKIILNRVLRKYQ